MEVKRQPPTKNERIMQDEEIIELYWKRDESAIEFTDRKYRSYLFTIAYNVLRDEFESDECLNDTYFSTWNSIPPSRPNRFQLFLSKITRNSSIDKYRKNNAKTRIPSEMMISLEELNECICDTDTEESEELSRELARVLNSYLYTLSNNDAFIFICRYYYFDKISKIADMLTLSEKTVYRRLSDIRRGLKECLVKEGLF